MVGKKGRINKLYSFWQKYFLSERVLAILLIAIFVITMTACRSEQNDSDLYPLRVGYSGGNLTAALYAAQQNKDFDEKYIADRLESISTVAYALAAGHLDIGFVDAEKLRAIAELDGFDNLRAVGKVTYPYGSTLILRKDLNRRLSELNGLNIAVSAPDCELLQAFEADADRLGADISEITYTTLAFDAMIPALEAGSVDGIIIKGFYSVIALEQGHNVLYQNWDVTPGDECCPAVLDQAALVLLADKSKYNAAKDFAKLLESAQEIDEDSLRKLIAENTTIPYEILTSQPVPEFSVADDKIIKVFLD